MVDREEGQGQNGDGVHPLDRDYTTIAAKKKWTRFRFVNRFFALGTVGFGAGLLILLVGIVMDQFKSPTNSLEDWGVLLHKIGSYCILAAGICVVVGQRRKTGLDRYVNKFIGPSSLWRPITCDLWVATVDARSELFVEEEVICSGPAALENVYLVDVGNAIAQLRWMGGKYGVINVCYQKRNEKLVVERVKAAVDGFGGRFVPAWTK